jgi:hypothetical protein
MRRNRFGAATSHNQDPRRRHLDGGKSSRYVMKYQIGSRISSLCVQVQPSLQMSSHSWPPFQNTRISPVFEASHIVALVVVSGGPGCKQNNGSGVRLKNRSDDCPKSELIWRHRPNADHERVCLARETRSCRDAADFAQSDKLPSAIHSSTHLIHILFQQR